MPLTLAHLEARLAAREARVASLLVGKRAAVAALLRDGPAGPEVLLMKRMERHGDRWSGHVSFPGGMESPADADLLATAIRETDEEVGIDLRRSARLLGRLDEQRAMAQGKVLPLTITPFVFAALEEVTVTPREEAESCFWLPLAAAAAGALDATMTYELGPVPIDLPCWKFEGYTVWGLTYQMLRKMLALAL